MANTKVKQQKVLVTIPASISRRLLRAQKIYRSTNRHHYIKGRRVQRRSEAESFAELYRFMPSAFFGLLSKLKGAK